MKDSLGLEILLLLKSISTRIHGPLQGSTAFDTATEIAGLSYSNGPRPVQPDRRRHVCDFPPPWLGDDLFSGVERRSDLLDWTTLGETMPLYALLGQLHFDHVEYLTTNDVSTRP